MNQFSTKHESASLHQMIPPQLSSKKHAWPPCFLVQQFCTLLETNSSPLKIGFPKRKGLSSNFLHVQVVQKMFVSGRVTWETWPLQPPILLMEEILHQLIGSFSHYLQDFIHPGWCRVDLGVHQKNPTSHAGPNWGNASSPVATCSFGVFAPLAVRKTPDAPCRPFCPTWKMKKWSNELFKQMARYICHTWSIWVVFLTSWICLRLLFDKLGSLAHMTTGFNRVNQPFIWYMVGWALLAPPPMCS